MLPFKWKTEAQAIFPWFVYHLLIKSLTFVHLFTKKHTEVIRYKQTKRTKRTCPSMHTARNSSETLAEIAEK